MKPSKNYEQWEECSISNKETLKTNGTKERDFFWQSDEDNEKKRAEPDSSISKGRKVRNLM